MNNHVILSSDAASDTLASEVIQELQQRKVVTSQRTCNVNLVPALPDPPAVDGNIVWNTARNYDWNRRVASDIRCLMLQSVAVDSDFWPEAGAATTRADRRRFTTRDTAGLHIEMPPLAITRQGSLKYLNRFDQLFPHFKIENSIEEMRRDRVNHQDELTATLQEKVIIFHSDFSEMLAIIPTIRIYNNRQNLQEFRATMSCVAIKYTINAGIDGPWMLILKRLLIGGRLPDFWPKRDEDDENDETDELMKMMKMMKML